VYPDLPPRIDEAEARPVASQADGELREEISAGFVASPDVLTSDTAYVLADAVLALPAVRRLLADAAKMQQVRELADGYRVMADSVHHVPVADAYDEVAVELRRALDGDR
jgi:hypothetical protein